jgi:hypothetical protein
LTMPVATATGVAVIPVSVGFTGLQLIMPVATATGAGINANAIYTIHMTVASGTGRGEIPILAAKLRPGRALGTGAGINAIISITGRPQGHIRGRGHNKDRITSTTMRTVDRSGGEIRSA